jgi:hypothetical protein
MMFVNGAMEWLGILCQLVLVSPLLLFILLLGSLDQSEVDPAPACLALSGAIVLGAIRRPLWAALLVAPGLAVLNLVLLLSRWKSAGLWDTGVSVAGHLLVVLCVICGGGWVLGRCIAGLGRGAMLCASWLIRRSVAAQS